MSLDQFFLEQLRDKKITFRIKDHGSQAIILCPFHRDSTPSLSIALFDKSTDKGLLPSGTFKCWSCNESGHWNKLAEKLDLKQIVGSKKDAALKVESPFSGLQKTFEKFLKESPVQADDGIDEPLTLSDWPLDKKYRGLSGKFIHSVGLKRYWDEDGNIYRLYIPVFGDSELVGYTAAYIKKGETKLKYKNSEGTWPSSFWMGLDFNMYGSYVRKVWKRYRGIVVVVEGPYDWLRCLYYGIPAIAILGNTYSEIKSMDLANFDKVIVFTDNDEAGDRFYKAIRTSLTGLTRVTRYKPKPMLTKEKVDPGSIDKKYLKRLRLLLDEKYSVERRK